MKNTKNYKEFLKKIEAGENSVPIVSEVLFDKDGMPKKNLMIDIGTTTVDFDLKTESFAYEVYQGLIKKTDLDKAIEIMMTWKNTISSWENKLTVEEVLAKLKEPVFRPL